MNINNDPLKRYLNNINYFKYKLDKVFTIGITGSCGKTSTSLYIYHILKEQYKNVCYIGTHKILFNNIEIKTNNTTLEIDKLIELFIKYHIKPKIIIMEVSSHGINQARINCFNFNILALTNLGSDHLDYHLNINNYHNVKLSFLNSSLAKKIYIPELYKDKYKFNNKNINFIKCNNKILDSFNTISFNKENMYLAYLILRNFKIKNVVNKLNNVYLNNGRAQIIRNNNRNIIIDYAHHIESFEAILNDNNYNKVVVFGCGGNRDKTKRSVMGKIASKYCKHLIITSDNSRYESLDNIIKDICKDINEYKVIKNRAEAIKYAINNYKELDIYILGKGDEDYIEENGSFIKFNDMEYVIDIINH